MSGFASPYEEDNPFADMRGSGLPVSKEPSIEPDRAQDVQGPASPNLSVIEDNVPKLTPSKPIVQVESRATGSIRKSAGRKPIRHAAIVTKLDGLDLDADPLGPLGNADQEETLPAPPAKESAPPHFDKASLKSNAPSYRSETAKDHAPSIPLAQAANPTFQISVGDPTRIGDITSAHTVYKVSTKTTSQAYKVPEFSVTRRYRDFLWLYDQLNRNSPGAIVPPPPEKQTVGRFADNFIEARRYALERMLEKIAKHPILRGDSDFKLFLESESFTADVKQRPIDNKLAHESHKGFLGLGSAFSISSKFIETDEFFDQKKVQFEDLDHQLKGLSKAVDIVIRQRKDLAQTTADFGAALSALSTVELSKSLSNALGSLSDLQTKIQELHERQAQQDLMTLGHTVEEYLRLTTSIKTAFHSRQRAWLAWQAAETESVKRRSSGDKIRQKSRTQQDRLNIVDAEMTESERRSHQLKIDFDNIGKLLRSELRRFDVDKVDDFKASVEVFLESAVEAQKEVIEHWEFFLHLTSKDATDGPQNDAPEPSKPVAATATENERTVQQTSPTSSSAIPPSPTTPTSATTPLTQKSVPSPVIPHHEANPFAQTSDE